MSKVVVLHAGAKDFYPVQSATVTTGWLPGQAFRFTSTGEYVEIADTNDAMFIGMDDDDELRTPPTGSLVTVVYGAGSKILIDHSEEVDAGSSARAYASEVESASPNDDLYINSSGKWQTTSTGSVKGKLFQVPASDNNYTMGVILRF